MEFVKNYFEIGDYASDGQKLGFGSFATVYLGRHKPTKRVIAIKVVDIERLARNNRKLEEHMRAEIAIMKSLHHENIVELLDAITGVDRYMYIMLEFCDGGDFSQYLDKQPNRRLSEERAQFFLRQLATGLRFLRSKKILHRDLKPQNLLISGKDSDTPTLKITDFGFARVIEQGSVADTLCGSPLYMAPEILRFQKYTVKADLWSVGIILWEMLSGKAPFKSRNHFELPKVIDSTPLRMDPALGVSPVCIDLIMQLLQKDPNNRISWEEFFGHPFLGFESVSPLASSPLSLSPQPLSLLEMRGRSVSTPVLPAGHPLSKQMPHDIGSGTAAAPVTAAQFISALRETSLVPSTVAHGLTPLGTSPPSPRSSQHSATGSTASPAPATPATQPAHPHTSPSPHGSASSSTGSYPSAAGAPTSPHYTPSAPATPATHHTHHHHHQHTHTPAHPHTPSPATHPHAPAATGAAATHAAPIPVAAAAPAATPAPTVAASPPVHSPAPIPTPSQPITAPKLPLPKLRDRAYSTATATQREPYSKPLPPGPTPPVSAMPKVRSAEDLKLQQQEALEKEFLFMSDAGSAEFMPDSEEKLLDELKQREVRAHVIGEIAELKGEQGERGLLESLSLWLKYLSILHSMLDFAHRVVDSRKISSGGYLRNYTDKLKNRFADALLKARVARSRVRNNELMLSAERLMLEYALHMGKEAAVDEMYRNYMKAEYFYRNGQHLLEQLLQDATDAHDRRTLREYISRFAIRLADATRKKEAAYPSRGSHGK